MAAEIKNRMALVPQADERPAGTVAMGKGEAVGGASKGGCC